MPTPTLVVGTNTFVTRDQADDYACASPRAIGVWDFNDDRPGERERLLITATRILSRLCWKGTKTDPAQALPFPRNGLTDREGNALPDGTTPQEILDAQVELAITILIDGNQESDTDQGKNIKRLKAGEVEVEFFVQTINTLERLPPNINELVLPFIVPRNAGAVGAIATGVSSQGKQFGNNYDLSRPLR